MKRYHLFTVTLLVVGSILILAPHTAKAHDEDFDSKPKERTLEKLNERNEKKREAFQDKLKSISDDTKRKSIEDINEHVAHINKRYTTMLSNVLSKYEAILKRIISKTSDLAKSGKNTATIDADITDAEFAIDEAESIISKQADTDYTIAITSESTLKQSVLETRAHLHADLKLAREAVQRAHDAIKIAAQTLQDVKTAQ